MQWASLSDFLNMGGYAFYVWGSYGLVVLMMLVEVVLVVRKKKTLLQRIARIARMNREKDA